jgi:CRP/FNR family cyclic AMP-dependent transcriptional regulator
METDAIGYLAAALVLAAFWMRSMSSLRYVAIASNLAFITYGYIGDLMPVLLLHILLLPVNVLRLTELGSARKDSPGKNWRA